MRRKHRAMATTPVLHLVGSLGLHGHATHANPAARPIWHTTGARRASSNLRAPSTPGLTPFSPELLHLPMLHLHLPLNNRQTWCQQVLQVSHRAVLRSVRLLYVFLRVSGPTGHLPDVDTCTTFSPCQQAWAQAHAYCQDDCASGIKHTSSDRDYAEASSSQEALA